MAISVLNADNISVDVNFTSFINKHPVLFFILALLVIIGLIIAYALPYLLEAIKKYKNKNKLEEIHNHTTSILELTTKINDKINSH